MPGSRAGSKHAFRHDSCCGTNQQECFGAHSPPGGADPGYPEHLYLGLSLPRVAVVKNLFTPVFSDSGSTMVE